MTLLVLITSVILFLYYRYRMSMEESPEAARALKVSSKPLTPSQRKTAKYFAVVVLLFLMQAMLGALLAHYYVEGGSFYGLDILGLLPFSIARGWHLQLAIFWVATAWLALGIFVAPLVSGREPKRQGLLVDLLFVALVLVVVGSLAGEWLGAKGYLGNLWFLLGNQGWEYLELGRVWQVLLAAGLALWLFWYTGDAASPGKWIEVAPLCCFYSAVAIPFFYGFAFFFDPSNGITMSDYWRWWSSLWVEDVMVFAYMASAGGAGAGHEEVHLRRSTSSSDPAGQRDHRHRASLLDRCRIVDAWTVFSAGVIQLVAGGYGTAGDGGATVPYRALWFLTPASGT